MASTYWIKLYHETLHDPKVMRLPDRLFRRWRVVHCARRETRRGGTSAGNIGNYWLAFEGARTTLGCEPFHLEA